MSAKTGAYIVHDTPKDTWYLIRSTPGIKAGPEFCFTTPGGSYVCLPEHCAAEECENKADAKQKLNEFNGVI